MTQPSIVPVVEYQFGVFTADVRSGELRKHGIRVKLQERPFNLLLALLQKPGELVTREELRERLWPGGTFVDFDHNISSAINKLRTALNDSATHPRYVETVGRRGYRFVYPVTVVGAPQAPKAMSPQSKHPSTFRIVAMLGVAALVLGAAGLALWVKYSATPPAPRAIRSIAVLPLKNLSTDVEQEYFSEGLTDELITQLASLQGVRVISRTSAMQYKDSQKNLPTIARELNVDAVVSGTVLRSDGRVRITAQLVDGASDRHLWARSYEREQQAVLVLQNEIARDIAENIKANLDPVDRARLARQINPAAHEAFLKARFHFAKRRVEDLEIAIRYFQQATSIDPGYARAYAGLAECYALLGAYSAAGQSEYIGKARRSAVKALELDTRLPEAHTSLAVIAQNYDWDWQTAENEYREAIRLDGNYATAHHWYAEFLSFQGRFEESFAEIERARQLDPLSLIIATDYGAILYYARQYDRADQILKSVLQRDADFPRAHGVLQSVYIDQRRFNEAIADAAQLQPIYGKRWTLAVTARASGRAGDLHRARRSARELEQLFAKQKFDAAPMVMAYTGVEDREQLFAWLENAYREHSSILTSLKVNPAYDQVRSDPRFQDLMKRVGLKPDN